MNTIQEPDAQDGMRRTGTLTRRQTLGGLVAAGLVTTGIAGTARAQSTDTTDSTPEATAGAGTGSTSGTDESGDVAASRVEEAIQRASEVIDSVQTDRDAVATDIETTLVDDLLGKATTLRDAAEGASSDQDAVRQAFGAVATARVARRAIIAELMYAGLPSQEERATQVVSMAGEQIASMSQTSVDSPLVDADAYMTTAESMVQRAEAELADGAYARAAIWARAAARLAEIPFMIVNPMRDRRPGVGRDRDRVFDGDRRPGADRDRDREFDIDDDQD